ncbi:DUF1173 domain-containing protein [Pseudomonas capeferrum]|uniref:DUF1173 domain-containing protein n=1 Tax=Pseudomonas capeferrum TaxID=1495066 RepID=UPI002158E367|nr:DUF1173 domain-containing protein [Pseudomonas capeferrum]
MQVAGNTCICDLSQARSNEDRDRWMLALERAWTTGAHLSCECPRQGDKRLRFTAGRLVREPGKGFEHAPACVFYFPPRSQSGMSSYKVGVRAADTPGEWCLEVGPVITSPLEGFKQASSASSTMFSLRALFDFVWTIAGLNAWSPEAQSWRTVRDVNDRLLEAARDIYLERFPLVDYLLVGTPGVKEQKRSNRAKALKALEASRPFIAIVPLAAWSETREQASDHRLALTDFDGIPAFSCLSAEWQKALSENPFVVDAWRGGDRVLAVILATPCSPRLARLEKLRLVPVSAAWLPLDSAEQRWMELKLREEQRCFWKPLAFDSVSSRQLPDFWLEEGSRYAIPIAVRCEASRE